MHRSQITDYRSLTTQARHPLTFPGSLRPISSPLCPLCFLWPFRSGPDHRHIRHRRHKPQQASGAAVTVIHSDIPLLLCPLCLLWPSHPDQRHGRECRGNVEVVLGKDNGTVDSEVVLGKVHDGRACLYPNDSAVNDSAILRYRFEHAGLRRGHGCTRIGLGTTGRLGRWIPWYTWSRIV